MASKVKEPVSSVAESGDAKEKKPTKAEEQPPIKPAPASSDEKTKAVDGDASKQQAEDEKGAESDDSSALQEPEPERHDENGPLMLKRGAVGHVDWFSHANGYGFIIEDGAKEGERLFVHCNSILKFLPLISCELHQGDQVEFDIMKGIKGKEAVAVTGIGGHRIGSRRFHPGARRGAAPYRRPRVSNSAAFATSGMKKLSVNDTDDAKKKIKKAESDSSSGTSESTDDGKKKGAAAGKRGRERKGSRKGNRSSKRSDSNKRGGDPISAAKEEH